MRRYVSVLVILVCIGALASIAQAATWPNEPPGSTVITENPFNPGYFPCTYCFDSYGWLDVYGSAQIVQDSTAPLSSPYTLSCSWSVGTTDGGCMTIDYTSWAKRTNDIYMGFWVKVSHNIPTKLMINFGSIDSSGYNTSTSPTLLGDSNGVILNTYFPSTVDNCHLANIQPAPPYCQPGSVQMMGNKLTFSPGVWHRVEARYKKSTTTTSKDGIVQMWLDGQVAMDYRNVNYNDGLWFEWQVYPGSHGTVYEAGKRIWFDHVRISDASTSGTPPPVDTVAPAPPTNLQVSTP